MFPWILYHVNDPLPGFRRWHVKGYAELDACMCVIVRGKLMWTALCAVRKARL